MNRNSSIGLMVFSVIMGIGLLVIAAISFIQHRQFNRDWCLREVTDPAMSSGTRIVSLYDMQTCPKLIPWYFDLLTENSQGIKVIGDYKFVVYYKGTQVTPVARTFGSGAYYAAPDEGSFTDVHSIVYLGGCMNIIPRDVDLVIYDCR